MNKSEIPEIHNGTIIESRNAVFFENIFPRKDKEEIVSRKRTSEEAEVPQESEDELRRSKRLKESKSFN
ncbi:hypothetical protein M9Y11_18705, partial [Clostridioides difficile]|nr:hypothetical protein [Clostridioides difficile]